MQLQWLWEAGPRLARERLQGQVKGPLVQAGAWQDPSKVAATEQKCLGLCCCLSDCLWLQIVGLRVGQHWLQQPWPGPTSKFRSRLLRWPPCFGVLPGRQPIFLQLAPVPPCHVDESCSEQQS